MDKKGNKYAKVEGLLYSYPTLKNRIENAEIDIKLEDDEQDKKRIMAEKERLELTKKKIDNMLDSLEESERNIIKLRYIDKLEWPDIDAKLNKLSVRQLIRERNRIINEKLIAFIN